MPQSSSFWMLLVSHFSHILLIHLNVVICCYMFMTESSSFWMLLVTYCSQIFLINLNFVICCYMFMTESSSFWMLLLTLFSPNFRWFFFMPQSSSFWMLHCNLLLAYSFDQIACYDMKVYVYASKQFLLDASCKPFLAYFLIHLNVVICCYTFITESSSFWMLLVTYC